MKKKLQVFVSSTYSDLMSDRQAAVEAILKAGHIPAGMELFAAGDVSQMDIIKRWIDESDVYMLILGGRYGSIESITGVSYTELEYDYARQQGKPIFAAVIKEKSLEERVKHFGSEVIEKNYPKELSEFRKKVLTNICSFFSDVKDIKLSVYESLSEYAQNSSLKGWISGNDVADTAVIQKEIDRLKAENDTLRKALEEQRVAREEKGAKISSDFRDLYEILAGINIKIPGKAIGQSSDAENDLFSIAYNSMDTLIHGVSNMSGMTDVSKFLYFNILPKLQLHGLADNEKVPGAQYRRAFLNNNGLKFFAEYERNQHKARKKRKSIENNIVEKTK